MILLSQPRPSGFAAEPAGQPVTAADLNALLDEIGAADLERRVHDADPLTDLADQILELADEAGVELIVLGLRRRSASGKLILGSSAQRILLEASCPVLAVKVEHRGAGRTDEAISLGQPSAWQRA
jgi:nucleotide-binding universal stress UspA family protein